VERFVADADFVVIGQFEAVNYSPSFADVPGDQKGEDAALAATTFKIRSVLYPPGTEVNSFGDSTWPKRIGVVLRCETERRGSGVRRVTTGDEYILFLRDGDVKSQAFMAQSWLVVDNSEP